MEDNENFDMEAVYERAVASDGGNVKSAMGHVIDSVSKFMAADRTDELEAEDYADMLKALDFARFIISGIMYAYGLPYCGHAHQHDEEEDE